MTWSPKQELGECSDIAWEHGFYGKCSSRQSILEAELWAIYKGLMLDHPGKRHHSCETGSLRSETSTYMVLYIAIAHNNAGLIEDSKAALMSRTAEREQQSQSHIPRFANQSER